MNEEMSEVGSSAFLSRSNEILIPANGDCLYTSVFLGYLLPVIEDQEHFGQRFSELTGENVSDYKNFQKDLLEGIHDIPFLNSETFKRYINSFKEKFSIENALWGGLNEISILSKALQVVIQELVAEESSVLSDNPYVLLDCTSPLEEQADLSQLETIYILRTNPNEMEVRDIKEDKSMQLARQQSAISSIQLQHYRLVAHKHFPKIMRCPELVHEKEPRVVQEMVRFAKTYAIAQEMSSSFQTLFNPSQMDASDTTASTNSPREIRELLLGHEEPASLLAKASQYIDGSSFVLPSQKTSERQTIGELMVRVGMQQRPQHFSSLTREQEESGEAGYFVGANFLREFSERGPLEYWTNRFQQEIQTKSEEPSRSAILEFGDSLGKLLRHLASDDVHDPKKDPLNKHSSPEDIDRLIELSKWLKNNRQNSQYDIYQREFYELNQKLMANRERALKEGGNYIFSLLKQINPELGEMSSLREVMAYQEEECQKKKLEEFEKYILNGYDDLDFLETNALRLFSDRLNRGEYGRVFYKYVCESFSEEYSESRAHQVAQQVWAAAQLDTIHYKPVDARTRMPKASFDGRTAANFGYDIASEAFQQWVQNSHVRACGDIVMDTFHIIVDVGVNLDIKLFLRRFNIHLFDSEKRVNERVYHSHYYDRFIYCFMFYLLEQEFNTLFVSEGIGSGKTVTSELKRASGSIKNLFDTARRVLEDFKKFSHNMYKLRPTGQVSEDDRLGLVFGIGFNGSLFNCPSHSISSKNEIFLIFSDSGRTRGGYLFLTFLKYMSTRKNEISLGDFVANAPQHYMRYLPLIRQQIREEIKEQYIIPDLELDSDSLNYTERQRAKYAGYMSQLELDFSYEQLSDDFKQWIRETQNWYHIPHEIEVKIPEEMPKDEHEPQKLARELLFDALTKRSFSKERQKLMSLLFLNWKAALIELVSEQNASLKNIMLAARNLDEISIDFRDVVTDFLDQLVHHVEPELAKIWEPAIQAQFRLLMKPREQAIEKTIQLLSAQIKSLNKAKVEKPEKVMELETKRKDIQIQLEQARQQQQSLPKKPVELGLDEYEKFRSLFFEDRSVSQCVEPVFSRVLGHDRFLSIFISRKVRSTLPGELPLQVGNRIPQDVIAPCDKRCQLHALGHLYVGDMLSYQSADRLNYSRRVHHLEGVPDRLMTMEELTSDRLTFLKKQFGNMQQKSSELSVQQVPSSLNNSMLTQYSSTSGINPSDLDTTVALENPSQDEDTKKLADLSFQ